MTRLCALLLLAIAAALPARAQDVQPPAEEGAATAAAGYGRAFGRIEYVEDGKVTVWSSGFFESASLTLFVRSVRSGQMLYLEIPSDGNFYWPLEAGEHVIVGYQMVRIKGARSSRNARLMAAFSVPRAGQAAYIGDLRIDARGSRVTDGYEQALARSEARLAAEKFEAVKALMRFERPPGRYSAAIGICAERWGLACGEEFRGVEPVKPSAILPLGALRFPTVDSLTPQLEWKPAGKAGLTYDVVIYESLSFTYGLTGAVEGLRGSLVAYAEGLSEPRHVPAAPLEAGRRFEWSVRLREGDIVSTWSTTSYTLFILVAGARRSGLGFGFETPAK